MASDPTILGIPKSQLLGNIGTALLRIKNNRGLRIDDMADVMRRSDEAVSQYIAGESEMGVTVWLRSIDEWPELPDLVAETAAERAARAKQRALDLNLTNQRERQQ